MSGRDPTGASDARISRLSAAILRISRSLDLATVLEEVVESARALTGARRLADERRAALAIPVIAVVDAAAADVGAAAASGARATLTTAVAPVRREARNVAAILPGSDPGRGQALVTGAHYDHLGLGGDGSLLPKSSVKCTTAPTTTHRARPCSSRRARALAAGPSPSGPGHPLHRL